MKRKIFNISLPLFVELFETGKAKNFIVEDGFPKDSRIIDIKYDGFVNIISICVENDGFDEIPQGGQLPIHRGIILKSS